MPTAAETFLAHLQSVFGDEDAIHKAAASDGGPPVAVFVYNDIPVECSPKTSPDVMRV